MSRRSSQSYDGFSSDALDPIREGHRSTISIMDTPPEKPEPHVDLKKKTVMCPCKENLAERQSLERELQKVLEIKEEEINEECQRRMNEKMEILKDRFNEILRNEQIRSCNLMRQVHQDGQEKVSALRRQLECSNLAALMYVLCSERRRCKLQIMKVQEEYRNYINALKEILEDSQRVILDLSRGYRTAARVDDEWRRKMKTIIKEFHNFICNFAGGCPDVNQYFLDIPELLKIEASTKNDPAEDLCDETEESIEEPTPEAKQKLWWDDLGEESHPFVVFGDMADIQPRQRREVLRKAAKTAPKKWKEYAFNNMFLKDKCNNMAAIKDQQRLRSNLSDVEYLHSETQYSKQCSETSRRVTGLSLDYRNGMGSIMKMMASNGTTQVPTSLLAAKDSFEIISATRLREKKRSRGNENVTLKIGNKVEALFDNINEDQDQYLDQNEMTEIKNPEELPEAEENDEIFLLTALGSVHNDSLEIIPSHIPEEDHVIRYEKICPVEECQRKQVDEFMKSLPPYMQASPHMHYEKTYDEYETCSPEQLKILEKRMEESKRREKVDFGVTENPLSEWTPSEELAVQTLEMTCNCRTPSPTPASSTRAFTLSGIMSVKKKVDEIKQEHFFNDNIEFDRFQVVGQDDIIPLPESLEKERLSEIKNILKIHPSLCEIFEGSVPC